MPKPKGWSNMRTARRDRLAKRLTRKKGVGNAWAVATAAMSPKRVPRLKKRRRA